MNEVKVGDDVFVKAKVQEVRGAHLPFPSLIVRIKTCDLLMPLSVDIFPVPEFQPGDEVEVSHDNKGWEDGWFFATDKKADWNSYLCYTADSSVCWFCHCRRPQPKDTEESLLEELYKAGCNLVDHGDSQFRNVLSKVKEFNDKLKAERASNE